MERQTRAQQRAAAIDVSPARLAAEIERLTRERDLARRQAELARQELAQIAARRRRRAEPRTRWPRTAAARQACSRAATAGKQAKAIDELTQERDDYLAALQRERAEFVNFRRRTAEEREAMLGLAAEGLIRKVLGLADDFDLAVEHRPDDGGAEGSWVEGIVAIDRKLRQLLESEGVTAIDAAPGTRFDPREHEAVANVPNTGPARRRDRRRAAPRLPAPRPGHPAGARRRRGGHRRGGRERPRPPITRTHPLTTRNPNH